MNSENKLLDKVKELCSIPSDNALAITLNVQRQAVSKIRRGEMPLSDERIAQLCNMANLDGPVWLAKIHAERATSKAEQAMWRTALDRLSAAVAAVAPTALILCGTIAYAGADAHRLYIMSRRKVAWALLRPMTTRRQRTLA